LVLSGCAELRPDSGRAYSSTEPGFSSQDLHGRDVYGVAESRHAEATWTLDGRGRHDEQLEPAELDPPPPPPQP
jgi:hypothetical protein